MATPYRQIFGSENAETDDLLYECYVPPPGAAAGKPILIGRWGTGKTGHILHKFKTLEDQLVQVSPKYSRIWYLDEKGIDRHSLNQLKLICEGDLYQLRRSIENIWDAEIVRTTIFILDVQRRALGLKSEGRWKGIERLNKAHTARSTVWNLIPTIASILIGRERSVAIRSLFQNIQELTSKSVKTMVHDCIQLLPPDCPRPVVAIEPIETPNSEIEQDLNVAQMLVTGLLNVFIREYQPSSFQPISVYLSVPWHRYIKDELGQPQKLFPYVSRFRWDREHLRQFINERIQYEFRRVRRAFQPNKPHDAWDTLFPPMITNVNTSNVREQSFDYYLRHSQYRVRDVIRMARETVEEQAASSGMHVDDVLSGKGSLRISERAIRSAVREASRRTASDRILEAERRFPGVKAMTNLMKNLPVPFDADELKKRLETGSVPLDTPGIIGALELLWQSGIIGIQLTALSDRAESQLDAAFGRDSRARYKFSKKRTKQPPRFYSFEHNTADRGLGDILSVFGRAGTQDIDLEYVLHPMMFEYLDARLTGEFPIGC